MAKKETKTNAMRILERMKIPFEVLNHESDNFTDGISSAAQLQLPVEQVFKTIVTTGKSKMHYVFVLPVHKEIDFKKAVLSELIGIVMATIIMSIVSYGLLGALL